jgi:TolB-like protein/class 3 adenylate cyclase/lipoprotein NlpI
MEPDNTFTRRVCAVLLADVTGFSKLMGENDERTAHAVHHLQSIAQGIVGEHNGRAEPVAGDALFATFDSVVAAVQAAVALQRRVADEPFEGAPGGQPLQIRIGVHLGDVLLRDGRAFGDAINIAARLEALARPGTICISEGVYRQVRNTLEEQFVDLGRQKLKNISDPVHAYLIVPSGAAQDPATRRRAMRWAIVAAALVMVAIGGGVAAWRHQQSVVPSAPPSIAHNADRKSVAVLPFANMSGNDADEYLSDGMSEEIITVLSKISDLRVAARTSSFFFKGKNEDIKRIGEQLRVGTVLEGSVRKAGTKLRVTAQLINVDDGYHVWSETYDEDTADILAIESDVAQRVAGALRITLLGSDAERLRRKATENPEAHQLYLKGRYYVSRFTEDGLKKGRNYLEQAIALDPSYALAYQGLAYHYLVASDWFAANREVAGPWRQAAEHALQIDPTLAEAHTFLATLYAWYDWNWSAADDEYRRALAIDPGNVVAHEYFGQYLVLTGHIEEGIAAGRRATAIDPLSAAATAFLGADFYFAHRYDDAIAQLSEAVELDPSYWYAHHYLGQSQLQKGDVGRALAELRRANEISPHNPEGIATLGVAFAMAGNRDAAYGAIDELRQLEQRSYVAPYDYGVIYAALHETDQAIASITQACDDRSSYIEFLKADPQLDPLRSDPRFAALLTRVGLGQVNAQTPPR